MSLVVEFQKSRAVGMPVLQVEIVNLGLIGCMTALLANVHLNKQQTNNSVWDR